MTRRAFVAGATGYTGLALVEQLRALDITTIAHIRPDSPELSSWREHFGKLGAIVDTRAWTIDALQSCLAAQAPTEIHCLIGTTAARGRLTGDSYDSVDRALAERLITAAASAAPAARFMYLSSIGADKPRGEYLAARAAVEQRLRESALPWTILRPSFITGDRREARPKERLLARSVDAFAWIAAQFGASHWASNWQSTDARSLAVSLAELADDPTAAGRIIGSAELQALCRGRAPA